MTTFERTIFIGDVHGCIVEVEQLVNKVRPRPGADRFVFAGDLVDKGPDSVGVVRFVKRVMQEYPGSECVMGNHDANWVKKAMKWRFIPDVAWGEVRDSDIEWMAQRPMYWRDDHRGIFVCHAGVFPKLYDKISAITEDDKVFSPKGKRFSAIEKIMYVRYVTADGDFVHRDAVVTPNPDGSMPSFDFWWQSYQGREGFVVFGHTPDKEVIEAQHALGIDTGCVHGGKLTAAIFKAADVSGFRSYDIEQVLAKRAYAGHPAWNGQGEDPE